MNTPQHLREPRHVTWFLAAAWLASALLGATSPARAQLSIGISVPGVSIGFSSPSYPQLERIPGYPVYYAPQLASNFFFYDGMYWLYQRDTWYASTWYDGPWGPVDAMSVPLYVLRIPVRYYRAPPTYFRGEPPDAPPRWGAHWGPAWEQRRNGWDRWSRNAAPPIAALPIDQRQYGGERYPDVQRQRALHEENTPHGPQGPDGGGRGKGQGKGQDQELGPRQAPPQVVRPEPPREPGRGQPRDAGREPGREGGREPAREGGRDHGREGPPGQGGHEERSR